MATEEDQQTAPTVITEFLTKRQQNNKVGFSADEDAGVVVISLKEGSDIFEIPIPGEQLMHALIGLYEQGSVRFTTEENQHLVFRIGELGEEGKVNLLFFREDNPLVVKRTITNNEALLAYSLSVGTQNGNFLAKPARKKKPKSDD